MPTGLSLDNLEAFESRGHHLKWTFAICQVLRVFLRAFAEKGGLPGEPISAKDRKFEASRESGEGDAGGAIGVGGVGGGTRQP